jgi:hypothetical protein
VVSGAHMLGGGQSQFLKTMRSAGPAEYIDGVDF